MTDDTIEDLDESDHLDFKQLLATVMEVKDIIWTIPTSQVDLLKEGLQDRKAKDNQQLKKAGLLPMTDTLDFLVYPANNQDGTESTEQSCVRVKLIPRKGITILKTEIPTDEL